MILFFTADREMQCGLRLQFRIDPFMTRGTLIVILTCATLLIPACRWRRQVPVPPLPLPQASEPEPAESLPQPGPEPEPEVKAPEPPPFLEPEPPPSLEPEPEPVPVSPPPESERPTPAPPAPSRAETKLPQPAPRLAPLLSPAERERFLREIDHHLTAARRNVLAVEQRQLTVEGQASLSRVRMFISQAEDACSTDLPTARGLAERASVLAKELSRSSR